MRIEKFAKALRTNSTLMNFHIGLNFFFFDFTIGIQIRLFFPFFEVDEEFYEVDDTQISTIEDKNTGFYNMLEYCQKTFVAHRFGTQFIDIGEINVLSPIIKKDEKETSFFFDLEKKELIDQLELQKKEIERLNAELEISHKQNEELIKKNEDLQN